MGTMTITQSSPSDEKLYLYPSRDLSGCIEWSPSDGAANYKLVDDPKDVLNTSDYINSLSPSFKMDLYEFQNTSGMESTINYVKEYGVARASIVYSPEMEFYLVCSPNSTCTNYYMSNNKPLVTNWAKKSYVWAENPSTSSPWTWDDINDMALGIRGKGNAYNNTETTFKTLRPSSDGDVSDWGYVGDSPSWKCVDEDTSDDDSTYIDSAATGSILFNIENSGLEEYEIKKITISANCRETSSSTTLKIIIKTHDTTYETGDKVIDHAFYDTISHVFTTNPSTSSSWTPDELNNLQIGLKNEISTCTVRCTQMYVTVEYYTKKLPYIWCAQCYTEIGYTPPSRSIDINKPESISIDHDRNIKMLNFWEGSREVYDLSRNNKTTVMRGMEYLYDGETPSSKINTIRNYARNGATITISDLDMYCYNGDYKIRSFGWKLVSKKPEVFEWILELEDTKLL
jgi:hypothetical protein